MAGIGVGSCILGGAVGCLAVVAGCGSNITTPFPPGLDPIDAQNTASFPAPKDGDPHPEDISSVTGETDDYGWVHAKGYVHAPIAKTEQAMRAKDVCVDRRKVDEWTIEYNVEPEYRYSQRVHNTVHSLVTIEFDVTWRQDIVTGTPDAPTLVAGRFMKTFGSSYLNLMAGSMVARRLDDQTTEIELIEHLEAHGQGPGTAESFMHDYFWSIVAAAHDKPLPTY